MEWSQLCRRLKSSTRLQIHNDDINLMPNLQSSFYYFCIILSNFLRITVFRRFQREEKASSWQFALAVLTSREGSEVSWSIDWFNIDWSSGRTLLRRQLSLRSIERRLEWVRYWWAECSSINRNNQSINKSRRTASATFCARASLRPSCHRQRSIASWRHAWHSSSCTACLTCGRRLLMTWLVCGGMVNWFIDR